MRAEWQEQLVFTNDFKIRFCNGYSALQRHAETCSQCTAYLGNGDGDLCGLGKKAIKLAMTLQDEVRPPGLGACKACGKRISVHVEYCLGCTGENEP